MSLYCYKSLRGVVRTITRIPSKITSNPYAFRGLKINYAKPEPISKELYAEKNMRLRRPMAPCLAIYKIQLTSGLSLMHRISGILLSTYTLAMGLGALLLPQDLSHYASILEGHGFAICTMKIILAMPFCYHFANGVRHLIWDVGKMLKLQSVYKSGYFVVALTLLSTAWLVTL